jgi:hypothetical protein
MSIFSMNLTLSTALLNEVSVFSLRRTCGRADGNRRLHLLLVAKTALST